MTRLSLHSIITRRGGAPITNLSRLLTFLAAVAAVAVTLFALYTRSAGLLLPGYTIIANLTLGGIVILQNPRGTINRSFSLMVLFIALWSLSNYLSDASTLYVNALFWNRAVFGISSLIPIFSVLFVIYFPEGRPALSFWDRALLMLPGIFLSGISFLSGLVIQDVQFVSWGTTFTAGPLFFLHSAYLFLFLGYTIYHLARKYFRFQGSYKMQIRYVFLGGFLSVAAALATNVVLPTLGYFRLTALGPSFMLVLVAFATYAIIRHRLMSIEIIIQRSAVYAVATVLIMSLYALAVIVSEIYLRRVLGYSSLFVTAAAALLIAIAYQPLVRSFQLLTDRIFFRGRYDYQKTLRRISHEIASVIQLEELTRLIVTSFVETMRSERDLVPAAGTGGRAFPLSPSTCRATKRSRSTPATRSSPGWRPPRISWCAKRSRTNGRWKGVREAMERLGIPVWVPIILKDELIGIIALGNKLSGEVFTPRTWRCSPRWPTRRRWRWTTRGCTTRSSR